MPSTWFRSLVHNAAPPSLHRVREGPFPRFHANMGRSDSRPSLSSGFVIAWRHHPCVRFAPSGRDARPWAPGSWYSGSRAGECRSRRTGLPGSWKSLMIIVRVLRPRQDQARSAGPSVTTPDAAPAYVHNEGSKRL